MKIRPLVAELFHADGQTKMEARETEKFGGEGGKCRGTMIEKYEGTC